MRVVQLSDRMIGVTGALAFLLCVFYVLNIMRLAYVRSQRKLFLPSIVFFLMSFGVMYSLETVASERITGESLEPVSGIFKQIPFGILLILLIVSFLWGMIGWLKVGEVVQKQLTAYSLRQGLNQMPDGICFGTTDGIPLLVNEKMQAICHEAFGSGVLDTEYLKTLLIEGRISKNCEILRKEDNVNVLLRLSDGSVWDFRRVYMKYGRRQIKEYVAYNVTQTYEKGREIEKRNAHLASLNESLREYNRNLDLVTREQEILAAKIKIHDEVGKTLLAFRAYLAQPKEERERQREELISMWRFTIALLRREAAAQKKDDRMEALLQAAQAVDVRLQLDGELPASAKLSNVIFIAIHECLTNTVKHTDGDFLRITIREEATRLITEITNNGTPPREPVTESGGLGSLRKTVELNGGQMQILCLAHFVLRIELPKDTTVADRSRGIQTTQKRK
ncbi:MAG: hypothetical protein E7294_04840 [Lachnospiraceae bacterium]|nr:hypothetical protein [Lachnospiraceae bacterium]